MVYGVGQLKYASQIWLKQTHVAMVTKICDLNTKSAITYLVQEVGPDACKQ